MAKHNYKIPVVSGGFDPIHSGHIAMLKAAAEVSGQNNVVVLLNSDDWLARKKGKPFMPYEERKAILENLKMVARVVPFDDSDGSARDGLETVRLLYPMDDIVFCNGGDRTVSNIPEMSVKDVEFLFGIGGENKANSSSWILREAIAHESETRVWGSFHTLYQTAGCKVKELVIKPNSGISYQRHFKRSEVWFVRAGEGYVRHSVGEPGESSRVKLYKNDVFVVTAGTWHQLYNESDQDLNIIEIQYGTETSENDIERLEYYVT